LPAIEGSLVGQSCRLIDLHQQPAQPNLQKGEGFQRNSQMSIRIGAAALGLAIGVFPVSSYSQELGSASDGHMLASSVCAECHAVEKGALRSRNDHAPTFQNIAKTPGMTPMAVRVWLRSAHREMPNLVLKPNEVDDVIAYLETLK
jgi:mono/diheme cytochrome c family protein